MSTTNKVQYGGSGYTTLAVATLQSLASSATAGWQSPRVDNQTATLALDYEIYVSLTTANTAPANDKQAYVYAVPWIYDGSSWHPSDMGTGTLPSGSDATATIASPNGMKLLGVMPYTTQNMTMQGIWNLSNAFGQFMPDGFSLIVVNFTGAALSTSCVVAYRALNETNS